MAVTFAVGLRACCVAVGLLLVTMRAAEPVSPLIGVTREQLLSRYGEPRSQMTAGSRVVYIYPRERIVLRDDVVVEVEQLSAEPARRTSDSETTTTPPPGAPSDSASPGTRATTPSPQAPVAPGASDSKVEIKLVRPPSSKDSRPVTPEPPKSAPVSIAPALEPVMPKSTPTVTSTPPSSVPPVSKKADKPSQPSVAAKIEQKGDEKSADKKAEELAAKKKKDEAVRAARRRMEEAAADTTTPGFGGQTYLLALAVVVGGAALLYWRYRQRQFVLAATSVSSTPLTSTATPVFTGNGFTAEELGKLEWNRFEELVTAYYIKTGVVAARTKTGPESPVQIKISWKGEPRPFAYVQCIARPNGLIDAKPLHALVATLAADDIRRGYVVTSGKFNVQARDLAEEKHLTLLPGDIFLEKLNALPAAARAEIMQSITTSESEAPSCPKCDAKMVRATDGSGSWRCQNHPDQVIPVQK